MNSHCHCVLHRSPVSCFRARKFCSSTWTNWRWFTSVNQAPSKLNRTSNRRSCSIAWRIAPKLMAGPNRELMSSTTTYEPRDHNDRLLLGLKGTMSEAELYILRGRLRAGQLNKARRGELITRADDGSISDCPIFISINARSDSSTCPFNSRVLQCGGLHLAQ